MARGKRFNHMRDLERFNKLQEKKIDRVKTPNEKEPLNLTMKFTNKEILTIQRKTKLLKVKYGVTRADVLRKVLLNLDDEELLCFLNLLQIDKLKK